MKKENIPAYEVLKQENLTDIHSTGYLVRHKKTGARLVLIENDDENKVFSIAFRTTPKNSTGVPHILEHSVLCGSREFPLKDPFVELVKGSLNTFLNAMTYPDKTCYPVASCNDQDFQNLMHVYLDAVFYPNIYKKEEIFRQEGWNYHLEQKEGPLTYNGVVYNEMKGAFSSPDEVLEREIMNHLFPDNTYGVESGGNPENIPELSYEEFLDFHRTYYHPSNSYIYLYGNMDMEEKLRFIDEKYLSAFEALDVDSSIKEQAAFSQVKLLEIYDQLKIAVNEGYFENLIQKWLLDNTHGAILTLVPKRGLAAQREKELADRLEAYRSSLSDEQLEEMVRKTKALEAYQESEERPEDLECIPMLKRSDIRKEVNGFSNEELQVEDSLFLYQDVCTNGIGYVNIMFEIKDMAVEKVHYLGLLKSVLGYVDTKNYTYGQLFNETNARTGGIQCGVDVFDKANDPEAFRTMFTIRGKALYSQMDFLFQMMEEILNTSKLSDTRRLGEIIGEIRSRGQASLIGAGHQTAVLRSAAYGSPMAEYQDEMAGVGYYKFIEDLEKNFQEKKDEIVAGLQNAMAEIIRKDSFMVSYTGERESVEQVMALSGALKKSLPESTCEVPETAITCRKKNEGFKTSGQVQYVARTGNFVKKGFTYTGALEILKVALSYDYLWINLRVKGGAYGCMSGFKRSGESFFVSYRDPHLRRTLEVYEGVPEYVRTFAADEREMTKYIIGTISGKDVPRTPQTQGALGRMAYFRGLTVEMMQKERDQILNATVEDIHALAPLIEAVLSDDQLCVVGSENAIEKAKDVFMETKPLVSC